MQINHIEKGRKRKCFDIFVPQSTLAINCFMESITNILIVSS